MSASNEKPDNASGGEAPQEMKVDEALARYMQQCDGGSIPDREAFLEQHSELRDQLEGLLFTADWIEELAGPTIADIAKDAPVDPSDKTRMEDTLPHWESVRQNLDPDTWDGSPEGAKKKETLSQIESSQPVLPCLFGDYVLERVLGRGGMGVVYQGRQSNLDRLVAIKMIRSGALASDEEVGRFYAEAKSAAKLQHPNIVTVYQCGEEAGQSYFSMDFVPGTDLSRIISEGAVDSRTAARYVRDVARAIEYAHEKGILHRDLKPANILVDDRDQVRITDFGLAKSVGTDTGLTAEGAALGTPSYMSPEQAAGKVEEQHHATDIYSLGAILFTLVTGKPPFKANSVVETIMHVIHRPAPVARSVESSVSSDVETIIDVCLQKSPERRYTSAAALADDLDRFLENKPIEARPMSKARRAWYWLLGVPIFGAVLDNRVVEPTDAHRWVQRGLISALLLMLAAWMVLVVPKGIWGDFMPGEIRVAAGAQGGSYEVLAESICTSLQDNTGSSAVALRTAGSEENRSLLERGKVDLALLQADAIGAQNVAVVAPLYYEAVHVFVRRGLGIASLSELAGRRVNVGVAQAGNRSIARKLLSSVNLSLKDIQQVAFDWRLMIDDSYFEELRFQALKEAGDLESTLQKEDWDGPTDEELLIDAAVIVARLGSKDIAALLSRGEFDLLQLPDRQLAQREPTLFQPMLVTEEHYPDCGLSELGIPTVTTTAYLAATRETPAVLVRTVLQNLFSPETVAATGIISVEQAAHWQGLQWHPAAREFFQNYRSTLATSDIE